MARELLMIENNVTLVVTSTYPTINMHIQDGGILMRYDFV